MAIKRPIRTEQEQLKRNEAAANVKKLNGYGVKGKELAELLLEKSKGIDIRSGDLREYINGEENRIIEAINNGTEQTIESEMKKVFKHSLSDNIAELLVQKGYLEILVKNLEKFVNLSDAVCLNLIDAGYSTKIQKNLISFENPNNILKDMNDKNLLDTFYLVDGMCYGLNLNKESLKILMSLDGRRRWLYKRASSFQGLDKESLLELLDTTHSYEFNDYAGTYDFEKSLRYFKGLDKEVALKLFDKFKNNKEFSGEDMVAMNLESFEGLDMDIAKELIKNGHGDKVAQYPEKFGLKKEK